MRGDQRIFDVIVIGAGLGGLTTAAFLSRAGVRVLVLEKAATIGGQCSSREVEGVRCIVGANGFGGHVRAVLKDLGAHVEALPSSSRMILGEVDLLPPMGLFNERRKLGASLPSLVATLFRLSMAARRPPQGASNFEEAVGTLSKAEGVREMFHLFAWLVGAPPSALPAHHLQTTLSKSYDYAHSWFPLHGSQAIPAAMADVIRAGGGEIRTAQSVTGITVEGGVATGVEANGEWLPATRAVVSNAEIGRTLTMLKGHAPTELVKRAAGFKRALSVANLVLLAHPDSPGFQKLRVDKGAPLSVVLSEGSMAEKLAMLEDGRMPERPVINLAMGEAVARSSQQAPRPISVIAPWPRDRTSPEMESRFVSETLERLDRHFGEFRILHQELVTPDRYEARFGFGSCVAPVRESLAYEKPDRALPIRGLFNVGTTVQPRATNAGSAVESGRLCANEILSAR